MPQPACHRPHVDTTRDQLSRRVVPELVDRRLDADPARKARVPLSDRGRLEVGRAVHVAGEHEPVGGQLEAQAGAQVRVPLPVTGQQRHRVRVQRDSPVLVGFGVLLDPGG